MKKMIIGQLSTVVIVVVIITLALNFMLEISTIEQTMDADSADLFWQIEQILTQNSEELIVIQEEHRQQCMNNADAVAYILSYTPSIMDSIEELKKVATLLNVDEIHIFDTSGTIVKGTNPEYFGFNFDSGEQIQFFKPMLEDKSLKLCQDITPNTAEGKIMQYAAVWNEAGDMIVQIGMEPVHVLELTKKNELSYIFSLLTTDEGAELYAVDSTTGQILGSTNAEYVDLNISDIGLELDSIRTGSKGFHALINGESTYCKFTEYESILIGRTCSSDVLYESSITHTLAIGVYLLAITVFISASIALYMNKNIVHGIADVNSKLSEITKGYYETTVNVSTTPEFLELSEHINTMVGSILNTTGKISYILDKANIPVGVFEYSNTMTKVRATYQIQQILCLDDDTANRLLSDRKEFEAYLEYLKGFPLESDATILKLPTSEDRYIRTEAFQKNDETIGFVMDVTKEVHKRQYIEKERDIDMLTQLYNRRALEYKLEKLFKHPELIKHAAMIMLDSDGLKMINDRFGHKAGDRYLSATADLLKSIDTPKQIIARQGGDEFVLFFYGCDTHEELLGYIDKLYELRNESYFMVDDNTPLPVNYSFGYAIYNIDGDDYITLLREADMRMYTEKRERKAHKNTTSEGR